MGDEVKKKGGILDLFRRDEEPAPKAPEPAPEPAKGGGSILDLFGGASEPAKSPTAVAAAEPKAAPVGPPTPGPKADLFGSSETTDIGGYVPADPGEMRKQLDRIGASLGFPEMDALMDKGAGAAYPRGSDVLYRGALIAKARRGDRAAAEKIAAGLDPEEREVFNDRLFGTGYMDRLTEARMVEITGGAGQRELEMLRDRVDVFEAGQMVTAIQREGDRILEEKGENSLEWSLFEQLYKIAEGANPTIEERDTDEGVLRIRGGLSDPEQARKFMEAMDKVQATADAEMHDQILALRSIGGALKAASSFGAVDVVDGQHAWGLAEGRGATDALLAADPEAIDRYIASMTIGDKAIEGGATLIPALINIGGLTRAIGAGAAKYLPAQIAGRASNATAMGLFSASQGGDPVVGATLGFLSPTATAYVESALGKAINAMGPTAARSGLLGKFVTGLGESIGGVAAGMATHGYNGDMDEVMIDAIIGALWGFAAGKSTFLKDLDNIQAKYAQADTPGEKARWSKAWNEKLQSVRDEFIKKNEAAFGAMDESAREANEATARPAEGPAAPETPVGAPVRPQEPSVAQDAPQAAEPARTPEKPAVAPEAGAYRDAPWPDAPGSPRARDYRSGQEYADAQMGWLRERARTIDDPEQVRRIDRAMDEIQNQIDRGQAEDIWRDQRALELSATTVGAEQGAFEPAPEPARAPEKAVEATGPAMKTSVADAPHLGHAEAKETTISDGEGGIIRIAHDRPGQQSSITSWSVPESGRGKGRGKALHAAAVEAFPDLQGQYSNNRSAKIAYDQGFRPLDDDGVPMPDAPFSEVQRRIAEDTSVLLRRPPEAPVERARTEETGAIIRGDLPADTPTVPVEPAKAPEAAPVEDLTDAPGRAVTGIKNAQVDMERAEMGKDPIEKGLARDWEGTVLKEAKEVVAKNKFAGSDLVKSLINDPMRPTTDTEGAVLDIYRANLHKRGKSLADQINDAAARGDKTAVADLQEKMQDNDAAFDLLDQAATDTGSALGRALNFRKAMLNDRYELTTMRSRMRAENGGEALSPKQEAKVAKIHAEVKAALDNLEAFRAKHGNNKALEEIDRIVAEAAPKAKGPKYGTKGYGESNKFVKKQDVEAAKAAAIAASKGVLGANRLPTEALTHFAKWGAYHMEAGTRSLADFTKVLVAEFGEKAKPYAREIWNAAGEHLGAVIGSPGDKRASLLKAYKTRLRREMKSMREQIDSGVKKEPQALELDAEATALRAEYQALRKDYRRIFGTKGITDEQRLSMAIKATERSLERWDKIIESGDPSPRPVKSKPLPESAELDAVRAKRDAAKKTVMDLRKELRRKEREAKGPRVPSDEARLKAAIIATEKSIKDYEARLAKGDPSPPKRESKPLPDSKRLDEARARRDELRDQVAEMRKALRPKKDPEAVALKRWVTRTTKMGEEYDRRVRENDLEPPKRISRLSLGEQELRLKAEVELKKDAWQEALMRERLGKRSRWEKTKDFVLKQPNHLARAIQTAYDFSGLMRQGGFFALSHPIRTSKAIPGMVKSFFSKRAAAIEMERIKASPKYQEARRAGLFLSDVESPNMARREEEFMGRWSQYIPGVAGSGRSYSTILNRIRMDSYEVLAAGLSKTGTPTAEEAKAIAQLVNMATGRAAPSNQTVNWIANANTVLFAPRNMISRFQMATWNPLRKAPSARVAGLVAGEYVRYAASVATLIGLAKIGGAEIETDPRSSDFLKIKIGNSRIDVTSGFAGAYTFMAQMATNQKKSLNDGEIIDQEGFMKGRASMGMNFLRKKAAPVLGSGINVDFGPQKGKNVVGEPVTPTSEIIGWMTPLSLRDIQEAIKEQGVPAGAVLGVLSMLGMGVQNFDVDEEKPDKPQGINGDIANWLDEILGIDWEEK